jgi:hypothetical protein
MVTNMTADGGVNDEIGNGSDNGGGGGGGGGSDFCSQDEWENVKSKQSGSPGKVDVERRDENLNQPAIAEESQGKCAASIGKIARHIVSDVL